MSYRILHIARVGTETFPRFAIRDQSGLHWDGTSWSCRPLIYCDQNSVSIDCFRLQRQEAIAKKCQLALEVPLRIEVFSNRQVEPEELRHWLHRNVHLDIDVSSLSDLSTESIVLGLIEWPRTTFLGISAQ